MATSDNSKIYAILALGLAVLAVVMAAVFTLVPRSDDQFASCRGSAIAGGAQIGGPFTLVADTGETVTEAEVFDKPALVYFGYTFCPDVCPLDTVRNADAIDVLQAAGHDIRAVFVSVDPARDTPDALADFTGNIHPDMVGLTGSPEQVAAAAKAYAVYYKAHDDDPEYYLVDHSTFTYLMLPETDFAEFFRRDISAENLAESVECFLDAA